MIVRSCVSRRTAASSRAPLTAANRPRHFHPSADRNAEPSSHYETLQVPTTASPAEIKTSFYTLSKATHPDLHPNDKAKAQRFVLISKAYAVLGSAEEKQRYDRDLFRARPSAPGGRRGAGAPHGSHSSAQSSGPGGRPASGLSRRPTPFRGPPPSFYRSGGWGEHGEKRREHAGQPSPTHEARGAAASGPAAPGVGPGGFATGSDHDVPHFDRERHTRTHTNLGRASEGRPRAGRPRKQGASLLDREAGGGGSVLFNFFVVGGTLLGVVGLTGMVFGGPTPPRKAVKAHDGDG